MVFNKYKDKQFRNIVYPKDGYYYTYEYSKNIGWHYVKGEKMENIYGTVDKKEADAINKKILDKLDTKLISLQDMESNIVLDYIDADGNIEKQKELSNKWDKLMLEIKKINRRITLFKNQC